MKCHKCGEADHPLNAKYCHMCGSKINTMLKIDADILDIVKQNSYSKRIFAAYEGRKYANQICKEYFGETKKNYKEYVEMLMVIHYPIELEKAILGKKYIIWIWISIILASTLYGIVISIVILFAVLIPTRRKLKSLCNSEI